MIALTEAEVDEARAGGEAAAARRDGSAEDVPYRLLGAPDRDKAEAMARLWFMAFAQTRAWMREQRAESVTAAAAFAYDPSQKRGPNGQWIKYLFGADALLGLFRPPIADEGHRSVLAGARGKKYRDFKRGKPVGSPVLRSSLNELDGDVQQALDDAPPTPQRVMVWYRPHIWGKDPDFPTDPQVGDVLSDDAPFTAEMEKPPSAAPLKYAIRIPEGTERVLPIPPLGEYKADKGGVLLGDGHQYKVAEVVVDDRGRKTVVMDLLPPEEQVSIPGGKIGEEGPDPSVPAPVPTNPAEPGAAPGDVSPPPGSLDPRPYELQPAKASRRTPVANQFRGDQEKLATYKETLTTLADGVHDRPVKIQVDGGVLEKILKEGKFKTVHSGAGEKGRYYLDMRKDYEKNDMGIPPPPPGDPVYGWIDTPNHDMVAWYGDLTVVLKPNVLGRTSVTFGDSLNSHLRPIYVTDLPNADAEKLHQATSGSVATHVDLGSGVEQALERVEYSEAQVHGGVQVSDIAKVVASGRGMTPALQAKLEAAGIEVVRGPVALAGAAT